jgi:hypothetical protein
MKSPLCKGGGGGILVTAYGYPRAVPKILSCMLNFLLVFSKPLMEGYMECRDETPFLKERWGFVFSESWPGETECKENRPYCAAYSVTCLKT